MDLIPVPDKKSTRHPNQSPGIALFMVLAAISVLSLLITEFTYIAQVNQKMAFDGLDQVKALYLAKSGFKLSLLRLKAYQNVKGVMNNLTGGKGAPGIPKSLLEKIWNFPFFYPIPTNIPGLTPANKDMIEKFQKESGLDGKFSAIIESESSKYNLNLILAAFVPAAATGATGPTGSVPQTPGAPPPPPGGVAGATAPSGGAQFNVDDARKSLSDYLGQTLQHKIDSDADFAAEYRDLRMEDLMDAITAWADYKYERKRTTSKETIPMKRGPFYSVSELRMLPGMDDTLYNLFAPTLTASTTPGININTMKEGVLRALIGQITEDEVKEFFKFRDSQEDDNNFKAPEDFFKYLQEHINIFHNNQQEVAKFQESLTKRNIRLVVDETEFKITVQAQMNQSVKLIEANVTLSPASGVPAPSGGGDKKTPPTPGAPPPSPQGGGPDGNTRPDPGIRVTFMRIL